jgi:lysozyme family protein
MPAVGELMADDPRTRDMPGALKLVPTVWAQRAANAFYASIRVGTRLAVDGVAGGQTLGALRDIGARIIRSGAASSLPAAAIVDTGHVSIPTTVYNALRIVTRVADPVGSTVGLCSWSAVPQTSMNVVSPDGDTAIAVSPSDIPVEGTLTSYTGSWSVESIVVPAVAFFASAALGVALVKYGAPKRGRR